MRTLTTLMILMLALLGASAAQASRVIAPPGNSGVSQYVEVVPSAGGGSPTGSAGHKQGPVLSPSTQHKLTSSGGEGRSLAAFAQSTGVPRSQPPSTHNATKPSATKVRTSPAVAPPTGHATGSALRQSSYLTSGSGGIGLGLPLVLALITVGAIGTAAVRWRRRPR
jgi:hypothetical protein